MTINEKKVNCERFFIRLTELLGEKYEVLGSCNKDFSQYLCPLGTTTQVTYIGKPEHSFRLSDHWNWYANTMKCPDPRKVQCFSKDMPWARRRERDGYAGKPCWASAVAVYKDGEYHVIYGEKFDRTTKKWSWVEISPEQYLEMA